MDNTYDDIKTGILSELTSSIQEMDKHDQTLDLRRKLAYHALMNRRYSALHGFTAKPGAEPEAQSSKTLTQTLN